MNNLVMICGVNFAMSFVFLVVLFVSLFLLYLQEIEMIVSFVRVCDLYTSKSAYVYLYA